MSNLSTLRNASRIFWSSPYVQHTWRARSGCVTHRRWQSVSDGEHKYKGYKLLKFDPEQTTSVRPSDAPSKGAVRQAGRDGAKRPPRKSDGKKWSSGMFYDESGKIDKISFHRFYLEDIKIRPTKFDDPGDWLGRIDVDIELLPLALRERPLDFFASDSRDLPTAQLCLEHYITTALRRLSKEEQRTEYCKDQNLPGRKALTWLLQGYNSADLSDNTGFLKALVHCLVVEGGERYIWHWLEILHVPTVLETQPDHEWAAWRTAVLRFFVESQVYWAAEGTNGINAALRTFDHSLSFCPRYERQRNPLFIGKSRAGLWIYRQLTFKGANLEADEELYDQFIRTLNRWKNHYDCYLMRADLLRKHPTKPSGLPSLEVFRQFLAAEPRPIFVRELFETWKGFAFLVNSAKELEREGYKEEARWMLDIGLQEMPNHFNPKARRNDGVGRGPYGYEASNREQSDPELEERQSARRMYLSDTA